jgi:hypothetical protein
MPVMLTIELVEAGSRFGFRWRPFAWEASVDQAGQPTTLEVFELNSGATRTNLTVTETSFDHLAPERRISSVGWARQTALLEKFLAGARDLRPVQD